MELRTHHQDGNKRGGFRHSEAYTDRGSGMPSKTAATTVAPTKTETSRRISNDTKTYDQINNKGTTISATAEVISPVERLTPAQTPRTTLPTSGTTLDYDVETKSEAIYRRSERAAYLLRDNNPNIADLSDPNRPTKLAERFSELYSNEYTDALEELEKSRYFEGAIIYHLLRVVRKAYEHCRTWNLELEKELRKDQKEIPQSDDEQILDRGKKQDEKKVRVQRQTETVVQDFMKKIIPEILPEKMTEIAKQKYMHFAEQCVEIIWWMCVQNPPIYLEWPSDRPHNQLPTLRFDSDLYRSYTKSGQHVDFCVWPLVRLYKDGPILAKGIAQGMN